MSVFPINRVQDILRRMDDNSAQSEAMKTCFGILAIMSREESNKLVIARDGMESVLNAMTTHVDKTDVQESGCDLLWSLAFNNSNVKDIIAKHGGASVLVRAIKRHSKSPDFLKSACGALSNMCQSKINQEGVATQGGLQPLVGSIHAHQNNAKLLPFVFDALASLIVSNEDNARTVSSLGLIPLVVASLGRHKLIMEVVKSGCHTLAILSDVKGQASKIAFAGGVPIILSLLDVHASYADLHRVAAVVILRMVQESAHVGREITANEGVRILLKSLEKGGAQQDTVAAVTHILFTVTNPSSPASSSVEPQLWIYPKSEYDMKSKGQSEMNSPKSLDRRAIMDTSNGAPQTALLGLLMMLETYSDRRDVVRASCRLLNNIGGFSGVIAALDKLHVLDKVLDCVSLHTDTKDVIESTCNILKSIHKLHTPQLLALKPGVINGLLILYKNKIIDEDNVTACADTFVNLIQASIRGERKKEHDEVKTPDGKEWEMEALTVSLQALGKICGKDEEIETILKSSAEVAISKAIASPVANGRKVIWSKATPRTIHSLLALIESLLPKYDNVETLHSRIYRVLDLVSVNLPLKTVELSRRMDKLLASLCVSIKQIDLEATQKQEIDEEETTRLEEVTRKVENSAAKKSSTSNSDVKANTQSNVDDRNQTTFGNTPVYWVEGDDGPGGVKRLLPRHPMKNSGNSKDASPRLLENWPNHLERLNPSTSINRSFLSTGMGSTMSTERMHICFEGGSAGGKGVPSRCATPVPYNVPFDGVGDPFEHSLTFDSEFESGNLMRAVQRGDANYDLFLRADLHTAGHTQWFYFAVSNTHPSALVRLAEQGVQVPPVRVRFNIVNLTKPDSLFNLGMRPVVYSCHDAVTRGISWVRAGTDISYYSNSYQRNNTAGEGVNCYYTLSFTIEFHNAKDTVLIAYSYPYTCEDYKAHIGQILGKPGASDVIRRSVLCKTLGGEDCDLLVITDFRCKEKERIGMISFNGIDLKEENNSSSGKKKSGADKGASKMKPALFLSGRVHPGETPASWMMKGILDFLTNNSSQAQLLRKVFVIYIVPILNPDGVIFGNNRCSLAGVDLNRQWKTPMKAMHPTIYHLKTFMMAQRRQREICMYIDLHGHSRKYNVFMYGCDDKKKPRPQVRAFPRFFSMHDIGQKYVCFADCSFHVKKGRESTARVVVAKEMNIPCSFTLEATFCGSNYGPLKHCHMNIGHMQEVGAALCDAILNFSISEGQVKDTITVPNNLKAVSQIEEAIAAEDGVVFVSKNREQFQSDTTTTTSHKDNEEKVKTQSNADDKDVDSGSDFGGSDTEHSDKQKIGNFNDAFSLLKAENRNMTKNEMLLETEKRRLEIKRLGNTMPALSSGKGALLLNSATSNNSQVILPMPPTGGNSNGHGVPKTTAGVLALRTLNASPVLLQNRKAQDDSSFQLLNYGKSGSKTTDGIASMDLTRRSAPDALVLKKNMSKIRRGNAFTRKDDTTNEPNNNNIDFEITHESPRESGGILSGRKGTNSRSNSFQDRSSSREKTPTGLPVLVVEK